MDPDTYQSIQTILLNIISAFGKDIADQFIGNNDTRSYLTKKIEDTLKNVLGRYELSRQHIEIYESILLRGSLCVDISNFNNFGNIDNVEGLSDIIIDNINSLCVENGVDSVNSNEIIIDFFTSFQSIMKNDENLQIFITNNHLQSIYEMLKCKNHEFREFITNQLSMFDTKNSVSKLNINKFIEETTLTEFMDFLVPVYNRYRRKNELNYEDEYFLIAIVEEVIKNAFELDELRSHLTNRGDVERLAINFKNVGMYENDNFCLEVIWSMSQVQDIRVYKEKNLLRCGLHLKEYEHFSSTADKFTLDFIISLYKACLPLDEENEKRARDNYDTHFMVKKIIGKLKADRSICKKFIIVSEETIQCLASCDKAVVSMISERIGFMTINSGAEGEYFNKTDQVTFTSEIDKIINMLVGENSLC